MEDKLLTGYLIQLLKILDPKFIFDEFTVLT